MKTDFTFKFYVCLWIWFILYPMTLFALPVNTILKTEFKISPEIEFITIYMTHRPEYNSFILQNPNRIVLNINNTFLPDVHFSTKTHGNKTNQIRISQNTEQQTRLVINLNKKTDYQTKITQLKNGKYSLDIQIPNITTTLQKTESMPNPSGIQPILISEPEPVFSTMLASNTADLNKQAVTSPVIEQKPTPIIEFTNDPPDPLMEKIFDEKAIVMLNNSSLDDDIFGTQAVKNPDEQKWILSGSVQLRSSVDSQNDSPNENKTSFKNKSILNAKYQNTFMVSAISDYLYFGSKDQTDDYSLDLFETYYKHRSSNFEVSFGKQIKRWGKTDQISPVDTLNPENLTEFYIPTYEERKIPIWMADFMFKKENFFFEGVFIPFFEPAKFDYFGTDWSYFSHLKTDIHNSTLNPALKTYFNSISVNEIEPDHNADGFEYAARIGGTLNEIDFGFTYHYAFEDMPNFQNFPVKNLALKNPNSIEDLIANMGSLVLTNEQIEARYLRTHMFGFEFETILHDFGFRGEAAYTENQSFLTQSFTSMRTPTLFWILGLDYTSLNHWYFNLQFGHQHISDHDPSILYFEKDNYSLIGEIKKDIISSWLKGSIQYTYMVNDDSYYLSPRLIYSQIDNLKFIFGMNCFEGSDNSIFGRYDHNDQIFLDIIYQF